MRKILVSLLTFVLLCCLASCGDDKAKTIIVGATPSPHAEILNSKAIQDYVKSKGYTLKVQVYQDYVTPNKALHDGGIDANYFQHIPYLTEEVETKGYDIVAACQVHNEPLNLYGLNAKEKWDNTQISIINDASNVSRAFELLKSKGLIDSYSVENFDAGHPEYTSSIGVTIECIDAGLLHHKVTEGGYAVIPGNYALTAWGASKATDYRIFGESTEVAYPNIIAVRSADVNSDKIKILVEAFAQPKVQQYIEDNYGPTVAYVYKVLE